MRRQSTNVIATFTNRRRNVYRGLPFILVGNSMKKKIHFITLLAMVVLSLPSANAQSDKDTLRNDWPMEKSRDSFGRRIERFVSEMKREFSRDYESDNDAFAVDTLPGKAKKQDLDLDINDEDAQTYEGDLTVKKDEVLKSDVVVKGGDLTVYGKIDGDALVVGGSLYVKGGGRITGNARVINGTIVKEDGGIVEGYTDQSSSRSVNYRENRQRFWHPRNSFDAPWLNENANLDNFVFRYNRVEGFFLGLGSEKKFNWSGQRKFSTFGSVGWGTASHTWRGNLGIARQFPLAIDGGDKLFEIGVEGYSLTDSKDQWLIDVHENTGAALLIHEDFRDYYQRDGYSAHVAYYAQSDYIKTELKAEYLSDEYGSLRKNADWSLFGGDKLFRSNPAIDEGKMHSIIASAGISTERKSARGPAGWSIFGSYEYGPRSLGGAFDFDQYILDIRRFQPISSYDNLNIRLRAGTSDGLLPIQKTYDLGGLGTLNGYPFKMESGNRMILVNAEYILSGGALDDLDFWPSWLFDHVNLLFFSDAGLIRNIEPNADPTKGFDKMTWSEFKNDIGAGFSNKSGSFRIGVAWRTDIKAPARIILRVTRPF